MDGVRGKSDVPAAIPADFAEGREDAEVVEATCRVAKRKREKSPQRSSLMDLIQARLVRKRKAPVTAEEKLKLKEKIDLATNVVLGAEGDIAQALRDIKEGVDLTDGKAENTLGQFYLGGRGVKKDLDCAFDWFLEGMAQGSVFATIFTGYMLSLQGFVKRDYQTAVHCCQMVKQQGRSDDLVKMAKAFYQFKGKSRNLQVIYFICNELLTTEFKSTAYYYLGMIQMEGIDICKKNLCEGLGKVHRAAELGNEDAQEYIKKITDKAIGIDSTVEERKVAFQRLRGVKSSHPEVQAIYEYGCKVLVRFPEPVDHLYYIGRRAIQIFPEGKALIVKAAKLGNTAAKRRLIIMSLQDENNDLVAPGARIVSTQRRRSSYAVL